MSEIRKTRQKKILEMEIKKLNSFFTCNDVVLKAKKKDPNIGVATVYRFLKDMRKLKEVHFYNCGGKRIYSLNKTNHSHFICEKCGKTGHIDISKIDFIKAHVHGRTCHFQLDIYGICERCLRTDGK